jgi:hypothetical protein
MCAEKWTDYANSIGVSSVAEASKNKVRPKRNLGSLQIDIVVEETAA